VDADSPRVRLVVLTCNGRANIERCFDHLEALDWPKDRLELVLVDNGSRDGSPDLVADRHPDVRIIRLPKNLGFPANNLALRDVTSFDYVGLVNDDAFVQPGYLRPLVEALEQDLTLGAASPRMLFESRFVDLEVETTATPAGRGDPRSLGVRISGLSVDDRNVWRRAHLAEGGHGAEISRAGAYEWTAEKALVRVPVDRDGPIPDGVEILLSAPGPKEVTLRSGQHSVVVPVDAESVWCASPLAGVPYDVVNNAGSVVLWDGHGADRGFGSPDGPAFDEPRDVFAWCGGAVLLRSAYLEDVGMFDERFFLYYEDTDLSWRGRARGWRHRYVPDALVRHVHAATTVEGSASFAYYTERNRLLMLLKNAPRSMVRDVIGNYIGHIYDAGRRDVAAALAQGRRPNALPVLRRIRALAGFSRLAPSVLLDRSAVRRRQRVGDPDLLDQLIAPTEAGK
jgi:GT2 family glycosyltransferase